jgi:hypothetical protein
MGGAAVLAQQPAAPQKPAPEKKAEAPANPLDDLIAQALRNNPDILVAEAKVREAEAELQRTRVGTAQKVASLQASIDIARKAREEAENRYRTVERLHAAGRGAAAQEDLRSAKLAWDRAIYDVVKLEGEMPALLGKMPGKLGQQKADANKVSDAVDTTAAHALRWLAVQQALQAGETDNSAALRLLAASRLREAKAEPEGSIADRMRKALDKPISIEVANKSLNEVLDKISDMLDKGITFRIAPAKPRDGATVFHATTLVSANFKNTPTGAVLQALNDTVPALALVVRDYGVLVCEADSLPPDAVLLHRFWKSGVAASDVKNPPADGEIRGEVTEIDEKSGLVRIKMDAADQKYMLLGKGHTLEVYREGPKPLYLGTIRIVDVSGATALGKPVGKAAEPIKKDDKVTSKLSGK